MDQLLEVMTGWMAMLGRPVVALQVLFSLGFILLYFVILRPRLSPYRRRLIFGVDVLLWLWLRLWGRMMPWLGFPSGFALLIANAYLLWLLLSAMNWALVQKFEEAEVTRLFNRVIQPLYVVILTAAIVAQLSPLLDVNELVLTKGFGQSITLGNLIVFLLYPYFLVVISEYPARWGGRVLQFILSLSESSAKALQLILRYVIIGFGLVWMLHSVGINATGLAAIAGGLSIGVGFGMKELISNFVSGLWLLFEGAVRPGDVLFLDGDPCEVRSLGLRASRLWRQRDNAELLVPNQEFFTRTTITYTGSDHLRRGEVKVSAAYRHDPRLVIPLLLQAAGQVPLVLQNPPPAAFLMGYGDSSIDYSLRYWIANPLDNLSVCSAVSSEVWRIFADNQVEIPFPQRVLSSPATSTGQGASGPAAADLQPPR